MRHAAYCHQCRKETETIPLKLSSGHIGNCCGICRALRKGRPFLSRAAFAAFTTDKQIPMPARAEGTHEHQTCP